MYSIQLKSTYFSDTLSVKALKLIRETHNWFGRTSLIGMFISTIITIGFTITKPRKWYASTGIITSEFPRATLSMFYFKKEKQLI